MREIYDETPPSTASPQGEPDETWEVAAIGPGWRPPPGEAELAPVAGRLELYPEALAFRADDAIEAGSGEPLLGIIPAASVQEAGPLAPGSRATPTQLAGGWMPRWQRRFRCPGFVVRTSAGGWTFECPHGVRRARTVGGRYTGA